MPTLAHSQRSQALLPAAEFRSTYFLRSQTPANCSSALQRDQIFYVVQDHHHDTTLFSHPKYDVQAMDTSHESVSDFFSFSQTQSPSSCRGTNQRSRHHRLPYA